jgi:hypothetical protein
MGFKKQTTIYELTFEDPDLEGLEIRARSVPSGDLLDLMDAASKVDATSKTFSANDLSAIEQLLNGFAKALVSWNLEEEDGTPVPPTLEKVREQEFIFILPVVTAWMDAIAGVSADLGKDSGSGVTFPEGSLPMETLS